MDRRPLSQQLAEMIRDEVISGRLAPGDALPTEPELAEQHSVSRQVVRDGIRILLAWGLIDIKHGRGMYVTKNQSRGFGEALLLALQRCGASAWDVEEFEHLLYPLVARLAAERRTPEQAAALERRYREYLDAVRDQDDTSTIVERFRDVLRIAFEASGNHVLAQLADPIVGLRAIRVWQSESEMSPEQIAELEDLYAGSVFRAIREGRPDEAEEAARRLSLLPQEAVEAMKKTPVGTPIEIPLDLRRVAEHVAGTAPPS